jgi:hypothetical protein
VVTDGIIDAAVARYFDIGAAPGVAWILQLLVAVWWRSLPGVVVGGGLVVAGCNIEDSGDSEPWYPPRGFTVRGVEGGGIPREDSSSSICCWLAAPGAGRSYFAVNSWASI